MKKRRRVWQSVGTQPRRFGTTKVNLLLAALAGLMAGGMLVPGAWMLWAFGISIIIFRSGVMEVFSDPLLRNNFLSDALLPGSTASLLVGLVLAVVFWRRSKIFSITLLSASVVAALLCHELAPLPSFSSFSDGLSPGDDSKGGSD